MCTLAGYSIIYVILFQVYPTNFEDNNKNHIISVYFLLLTFSVVCSEQTAMVHNWISTRSFLYARKIHQFRINNLYQYLL